MTYCCPWFRVIKRFTAVIYKCSKLARVFVTDKPFQPTLKYTGHASGVIHKHKTRLLERLGKDKRSCLLRTFGERKRER
jgi:hypothetical protein